MYDSPQRRKIYIPIAAFIGIILIGSAIGYFAAHTTTLPSEITALTPDTPQEPEVLAGIFNLQAVYNSPLSTYQANRVDSELQLFLSGNTSLKNLTINENSISVQPTRISFTAISNTGVSYSITGDYQTAYEMYVTIYDASGTKVYDQLESEA